MGAPMQSLIVVIMRFVGNVLWFATVDWYVMSMTYLLETDSIVFLSRDACSDVNNEFALASTQLLFYDW